MPSGADMQIGRLFVELLVTDEKWGPVFKKAQADADALKVGVENAGKEGAAALGPLTTALAGMSKAQQEALVKVVAAEEAEKARAAALGVTVAQLNKATAAAKAESAAMASAQKSTAGMAVSTGAAAAGAQNLRFQLFDVVQQVSAGQNPLMILNQQGFQIAQAFGGAGGAAATLKAALGPVWTVLSALASVAGPLAVGIAAVGTAFVVLENRALDAKAAAGQTAADLDRLSAAVKSDKEEVEAAAKAWAAFKTLVQGVHVDLAVATGDLDKAEGKTIQRVEELRKTAAPAILSAAKDYESAVLHMQAVERESFGSTEELRKHRVALDDATRSVEQHKAALDERRESLAAAVEEANKIAPAEEKGKEATKEGKAETKEATKAERERAAALKAATSAIEKLQEQAAKGQTSASALGMDDAATGTIAERLADDLGKAAAARETSFRQAEAAYDDALAAAVTVSGEAGEQIADDARASFTAAGIAAEDLYAAKVVDAEAKATAAASKAAQARVDASTAAVWKQITDEEVYRDKRIELLAELGRVEVDHAQASADERAAVEAGILGEIDALRTEYAEKEEKRQKAQAKATGKVWEGVLAQATSVVGDLLSATTDAMDETQAALDADAAAREKLIAGEALTTEETQALMTATEKQAAQERIDSARDTALALFAIQKGAALVSIAIDTAKAAMMAIAAIPPPGGEIAAAAIVALGLVQAGIVASQAPEFHSGGVVGTEDRRGPTTGLDPDEVRAVLRVGEGVIRPEVVSALGGPSAVSALNLDPTSALSRLAAVSAVGTGVAARPTRAVGTGFLPPPADVTGGRAGGALPAVGGRPGGTVGGAQQPIVVVSKIEGRVFDAVLAQGLTGSRLPRVRTALRRMSGVSVGLDR